MMDNEIVTIGGNMMMKFILFFKICLKNHFCQQCQTILKILSWDECNPPCIVVNNIMYEFCEKLRHLENK